MATGVVTTVDETQSTRRARPSSGVTCVVNYEFKVDGVMYEGASAYGSNTLCSYSSGDPVQVRYRGDDPSSSVLEESLWRSPVMVPVLITLGCAVGFFSARRKRNRLFVSSR